MVSSLPLTWGLLTGSLIAVFIYKFCTYCYELRIDKKFAAAKGCQPPNKWNSKWPLGLDLLIKAFQHERKQRILQFFLNVVSESGNTFEQKLLFARGIDTIDPRNIEAILSTQFADFGLGLRPPTFDPLMGSGIFTQDGKQWRHSRELLRPQFMTNRLNNFEQVRDAVDKIISCVPEDDMVDMQPLFFRLTFDTTLFLLFGRHLPSLKSEGITDRGFEFAEAFNLGQDYLAQRGRLGDFYWLLGGKGFRKACKICHDFVDGAVKKALDSSGTLENEDSKSEPYVFIDALVRESSDPKVLRDQCLNILLAGRDTTACCLTWTLRLLVQHPQILFKLRSEIRDTVGVGPEAPIPTISQIKTLPYLSLVIKEVLRLYPSVPVNSRAAVKTTTLPVGGGSTGTAPVLVRKGEAVGYCVYAMHRRKDIYGPDADEFRPERWENDTLKNVGWGYLPFNGGPRVCLGQDFALLEAGFTIVRLLQTFETIDMTEKSFKLPLGEEKQVLTLVVSSGDGCWVRMRRYGARDSK
ncbi:N-alkane-inducible cytochrome P450 [Penicillium ucsense]|uniref:N-alkane-inducible cytochrome P450 n=1 Tax=Penicillium ucsense TaxID=2839758 RepID=A0A8J8WIL0_9EURO|nr:N-alkane-inducible cytochrome P450 [Penicillium ucsense]KAF7733877.1 N-alkane-inducible cytochrome P450 [Penicillium ucsense]